ncbi:MAG TPA: ATP-binding protein [Candidatus Methylacidiphilales bacterium]
MAIRFLHLRLRSVTAEGIYGVDIPFSVGLVLLRAENSMGKSTCVQAILYALGLERMLSPTTDIPLPPAMLSRIERADGTEIDVTESWVELELANSSDSSITVFRRAKTNQNTKLITVYQGRHATKPSVNAPASDYFVHDGGAAVREMGFHKFLAEFIGWDLPLVTRFTGQECPLYIECIFPLLIVEQKHGWSGIQGNLPTFIGIREMGKRAIEFLLKLDAYDVAQSRQRLRQAEDFTKERWTQHAKKLEFQLRQTNARAHGVPAGIISGWGERDPRLHRA